MKGVCNQELFKQLAETYSLVRLHGKDPSKAEGKGWQQYCRQKRTFDEIGFRPGENAGIACGPASGVIVVDEDDREAFQDWLHGRVLPQTRMHRTGSGKFHYLYQYPQDGRRYGCRSFKAGQNHTVWDLKGDGSQVVAPGSVHPDTGELYTIHNDFPIAPAPDWLLFLALKEDQKAAPQTEQSGEASAWDGNIDRLPIKAETKTLIREGKNKGERSNAMMTVVDALVWANLTDADIFQIFEQYPIGEKWYEDHRQNRKWLQAHIDKARAYVTGRAEERSFKCTDMGNAERFAAQHGGVAHFCHPWEKWFTWDGTRWKADTTAQAIRLAKETVRGIYGEAERCKDEDVRKPLGEWARKSEARAKIDAMIALAKSEPGIPIEPHEFDRDEWLLNCHTGTIDLRTGALRPHNPADRITKIIDVAADPGAKCPTWEAFLARIMDGNENLIGFLQRAIGYSLTGDDSEQCLFLLYGTGRNGKSTFLDTIKFLMGDYGKQAEFSTFLQRKNETVRNDIADLRGGRFVTAIEAESGQRLAESLVKQMTGGDTLKARFLFSEYFEFRPTFKIFLAANHKPRITGTDYAIWRRIRLIPFTVTIPEGERDPRLKEKLKKELSGILNWALVGCAEWQEHGLGIPDEVRSATEAYRNEMDSLSDFLDECCMLDVRCRVSKPDLYAAYERWCSQNGEEPLKKRTFGMQMMERGVKDEKSMSTRYWRGIGLLEPSTARDAGTHRDTISGNLREEVFS